MEFYVKTLTGKSLTFTIDNSMIRETVFEVGRIYIVDAKKWEVDHLKTVELLRKHGGDDWTLAEITEASEYIFISVLSKISYKTQSPHDFFNRLKS